MRVTIRNVRPDEIDGVLALLFPDVVPMRGEAVARDEFVRQIEAMGYDLSEIVVALDGERLVGALMEMAAPDGTVLLARPRLAEGVMDNPITEGQADAWRSRGQADAWRARETLSEAAGRRVELEMIVFSRERARRRGMLYLQSLSAIDDEATRAGFAEAGFTHGATLLHMRLQPSRFAPSPVPDPPSGLTFTEYDPETHARFADTIAATYEGTLDCPAIPRVTDMQQAIETHKRAGRFDPALWLLVSDAQGDLGVILINEEPRHRCYDLVYMGVAPPRRGERLGRHVLEAGLQHAHARRRLPVELAVDETNAPAIRLYRQRGFEPTGRSVAMVLAL